MIPTYQMPNCRFICSQFCYYFFILLPALVIILISPLVKTEVITSLTRTEEFNFDSDPEFILHVTDVHLTALNSKNEIKYKNLLGKMNGTIKTMISTGDLTDNWGHHPIWKYSHQYPPDHEVYKAANAPFENYINIIDIVGNHDIFDVGSFDSDRFGFLNFSSYYSHHPNITYDNFTLSTEVVGDIAFVLCNPVRFPTMHALIDFFAFPTQEYLDRIEAELAKITQPYIVFLNHWPFDMWDHGQKSSSGKPIYKIFADSNVSLGLSGHIHPKKSYPHHHGQTLEIVAKDMTKHNGFGILTTDNGNMAYTTLNVNSQNIYAITSPPPLSQLTKRSYFQEADCIRMLVWGNDTLKITVSGDATGQMNFVRYVGPGVALYEFRHKFGAGINKVTINGDIGEKIVHQFYVGSQLAPRREYRCCFPNLFAAVPIALGMLLTIEIIILFPYPIEFFSEKIHTFASKNCEFFKFSVSKFKDYVFSFFFGFLEERWRILTLPIYIRIVLFACALLPLACPFMLQSIDGVVGFVWVWGYYNRGLNLGTITGPILGLAYALLVTPPVVMTASAASVEGSFKPAFVMTAITAVFALAAVTFLALTFLTESVDTLFAMLSILVLSPVAQHLTVLVWRCCRGPKQTGISVEERNEVDGMLLE